MRAVVAFILHMNTLNELPDDPVVLKRIIAEHRAALAERDLLIVCSVN
jgi:hypothetical protein